MAIGNKNLESIVVDDEKTAKECIEVRELNCACHLVWR